MSEELVQVPMASRSFQCAQGDARVLAATAPEAATAGTPMPGKVESPQQSSPAKALKCEIQPGNDLPESTCR